MFTRKTGKYRILTTEMKFLRPMRCVLEEIDHLWSESIRHDLCTFIVGGKIRECCQKWLMTGKADSVKSLRRWRYTILMGMSVYDVPERDESWNRSKTTTTMTTMTKEEEEDKLKLEETTFFRTSSAKVEKGSITDIL